MASKLNLKNPSKFINYSTAGTVLHNKMLDSVHNLEIIQTAESIELIAVNVENKNLTFTRKIKGKKINDYEKFSQDIFVKNDKIQFFSDSLREIKPKSIIKLTKVPTHFEPL